MLVQPSPGASLVEALLTALSSFAPFWAKMLAAARPIPEFPPVTSATFPLGLHDSVLSAMAIFVRAQGVPPNPRRSEAVEIKTTAAQRIKCF